LRKGETMKPEQVTQRVESWEKLANVHGLGFSTRVIPWVRDPGNWRDTNLDAHITEVVIDGEGTYLDGYRYVISWRIVDAGHGRPVTARLESVDEFRWDHKVEFSYFYKNENRLYEYINRTMRDSRAQQELEEAAEIGRAVKAVIEAGLTAEQLLDLIRKPA
jgi:hypothetical protein